MFTLLKVSTSESDKGISHVRENGKFVEKLFTKDANLTYKITDKNACDFGKRYAFFIIDCKNHDELRIRRNNIFYITSYPNDFVLLSDSENVLKMCEEFTKQNKALPNNLDNLLSDYFSKFFSRVIVWENKGFDSAAIFNKYEKVLKLLGKTANDFVNQELIDNFFKELCNAHDFFQINRLLPSDQLSISKDITKAIKSCKSEIDETIEIAKNLIADKSYEDITYSAGYMPYVSVYEKNTPCGQIGVHVKLDEGFSVILVMNDHGYTHKTDITRHCKHFKENFYKN